MPTSAKLRQYLRLLVANLLHYTGVLWLWRLFRRRNEVCVLGLHRVLKPEEESRSNSQPTIVLTEATFVQMLHYLAQHYEIVSFETFLSEAAESKRSKPRCLLTFDDGWHDNYTTAYPWLKQLGIPATILLTTGLMEGGSGFWVDCLVECCRDPERQESLRRSMEPALGKDAARIQIDEVIEHLKHMPAKDRQGLLNELLGPTTAPRHTGSNSMLTWEQVREMSCDGIEFGAHTVNHPLLPYEENATVEDELLGCKRKIEAILGKKVRAFAYPNGAWDERIRRWVQQTGYECAFTTEAGWHRQWHDRYAIRRIMLHEGNVTGPNGRFSPAVFSFTLTGWR